MANISVFEQSDESVSSSFVNGVEDNARRWGLVTALFNELRVVTNMTPAETQRFSGVELLSFDHALSTDANFDPRYQELTLDQRIDKVFGTACWVVECTRNLLELHRASTVVMQDTQGPDLGVQAAKFASVTLQLNDSSMELRSNG